MYAEENMVLIHSSYGAKVLDITSQERQIIYCNFFFLVNNFLNSQI